MFLFLLPKQVKGLNHRLNTMDVAEEMYKSQLSEERQRADRMDMEAAEFKRNVARLQMDSDKLEQDTTVLKGVNADLMQALKEAEDRVSAGSHKIRDHNRIISLQYI